ncbi:MAG: VWA domain-containing protein [Acidobacteria bacterium]|nr:VWA domain-containing protein [Acidobacteriota bacterium]
MPQTLRRFLNSLVVACALAGCLLARAQQQEPKPQTDAPAQDEEEVVRVETDLIQTGVMVFDKSGKFVDGLRQEDFELTVEGSPRPVSFFERVAGTPPASPAPRGGAAKSPAAAVAPPAPAAAGRTVIIFADDVHLNFEDRKRARDLIKHFVDDELTDEDNAAVISSSGRLGFLQQFTDNRAVLREAAARLGDDQIREATDRLRPPMTEYEALLIDRRDPEVVDAFASAIMAEGLAVSKEDATFQAYSRARTILQMTALVSRKTYYALEQALRRSAQMPGRKIVLFISDGFLLDPSNTNSSEYLRRVTDAAARANAVVYTFDARGLDAAMPAGTSRAAFRVASGERFEMQDPLANIAERTGGRFYKNHNDMRPDVGKSLAEASRYYLLAWRPDPELRGKDKFRRVEVKVKGRPELSVRLQNGYIDEDTKEGQLAKAAQATKSEPKNVKASVSASAPPLSPEQEQMRAALNSFTPKPGLPTSLSVNYLEAEGGPLLSAAIRVEGSAVNFTREAGRVKAEVEVVGVVYDSKGKAEETFSRRLSLDGPSTLFEGGHAPNVFYNYQAKLTPGLHQVRVAARDVKTGRIGSATQWVEVPNLKSNKLALSSLLVAETRAEAARRLTDAAGASKSDAQLEPAAAAEFSVDRRFDRTSALRYVLFVYNARGGAAAPPDVTLQTQIFRGNNAIFTAPPARVSPEGQDPARLAYAAEVPLEGLPPGRYTLRVTVDDRAAKATAAQRVSFTIK